VGVHLADTEVGVPTVGTATRYGAGGSGGGANAGEKRRCLFLCLASGDAGQRQGAEDDRAVQGADPLCGDTSEGEDVLDQEQQQNAGERGALAAVEADTAEGAFPLA
jgi:hypothetical protein